MTTILVHARFSVPAENRAAFESAVTELAARSAAEPGTLAFGVFGGEAGEYSVHEEYADEAAMRAHQQAHADLFAVIDECVAEVSMSILGEAGPGLTEWALRVSGVTLYHRPLT